jgi:glycosyltransferase involved in cell wall biosynthesis
MGQTIPGGYPKNIMPVVSVIIPNYNHAPFLKERIDSVLSQTYQDIEIIIIDDCSADNSREIIESYQANSRVSHIIYNETNSGSTFKQWQKGIGLATGKYIWIAESDDWCEPTLLEELIKGITGNDDIVISFCGAVVITDAGEILYTSDSKKIREVTDGISFIKNHLTESNRIFNASMAIFHKPSFLGISSEYTNYKFCGDWLFWIMLAQKGRVFISGKYLNYFRKHNADVSRKSMANGTYFSEYPGLAKYLLDNSLISHHQYSYLLFRKYRKLKNFEGSKPVKKDLLETYRELIGIKNLAKFTVTSTAHSVFINLWIITPLFIKNTVRSLFKRS